jgi:hypothetical protein
MHEKLDAFLLQIPNLAEQTSSALIDFFVYFITVIEKEDYATPAGIERCFEITKLQKYSNTSSYLSNHAKKKKGKTPKYIKGSGGYCLERNNQLLLQKALRSGPAKQETSYLLRELLLKINDVHEKAFLQEAIDCYEIGARRASIVLVWILTIDHLHKYIFNNELGSFNAALSKQKDSRIKIKRITKLDDFSDIPESKFIEITRASNIITNDVRKILDTKLGIRNTSAHPSSVSITDVKATDFILDLVENIILKY